MTSEAEAELTARLVAGCWGPDAFRSVAVAHEHVGCLQHDPSDPESVPQLTTDQRRRLRSRSSETGQDPMTLDALVTDQARWR